MKDDNINIPIVFATENPLVEVGAIFDNEPIMCKDGIKQVTFRVIKEVDREAYLYSVMNHPMAAHQPYPHKDTVKYYEVLMD